MTLANQTQLILLVFYVIIMVLFYKQNQLVVALYYLGCLVKDISVFILAYLEKR